jgi:hypothetical protein
MDILGTIAEITAPSPLYRANGPSFLTIEAAVRKGLALEAAVNCILTLIVSSGWQERASHIPAIPPAIK